MDIYANTARLPVDSDHFTGQPFFSFGTSHARQDVSAAQEGDNQYNEPYHYRHSASLATTSISCLKDDEDFVASNGESSRRRLTFLWNVVSRCCAQNYDLVLQTWLKLLEGGPGDDVWLWVDGDEGNTTGYWAFSTSKWDPEPIQIDWRNAASALSRRLERSRVGGGDQEESAYLVERRRRVQEADPVMRFSMIAWIVITSEPMKAADASRGLSRREKWHLRDLIFHWGCTIQRNWFPAAIVNSTFQIFGDVMKKAGHTCHYYPPPLFKEWINMRSLLNPDQRYDVVHLSLMEESSCKACAARSNTHRARLLSLSSLPLYEASTSAYSTGVANVADYRPPHYLVFLWILYPKPELKYRAFLYPHTYSEWLRFLDQMVVPSSSPLFRVSTLKSVDLWFSKPPPETRHEKWLPWVNFYPQSWRGKYILLSRNDWEWAETSILAKTRQLEGTEQSSASSVHDSAMSVDIRAWIGAVVLLMLPDGSGRKPKFNPSEKARVFIQTVDGWRMKKFLRSIPIPPEVRPTTALASFRCAVQKSHHTCYKQIKPALVDWYASAVSFINGTDHIKIAPLYDWKCSSCAMAKFFRDHVGTKNLSTSPEHQRKILSVLQELVTVVAGEDHGLDSRPAGLSSPSIVSWASILKSVIQETEPMESEVAGDDGINNMHMTDVVHSASAMATRPDDQGQSNGTETSHSSEMRDFGISHEPKTPRRPKGFMIKEIKAYFIKLLEDLGVPIPGLKNKQLPWTTLPRLLAERGWELDNWPGGVPLPGSGDRACDDNKGINGLDMKHLYLLYDAMKSETYPLGFRKIIGTRSSTSAGNSRGSGGSVRGSEDDLDNRMSVTSDEANHEPSAAPHDTSRKRSRDIHDTSDVEMHAEKRPRALERDLFT